VSKFFKALGQTIQNPGRIFSNPIGVLRDVGGGLIKDIFGVAKDVGSFTGNVVKKVAVGTGKAIKATATTVYNTAKAILKNPLPTILTIGLSAVGVIALGGTAFGASLIWWGEQMIHAIRGFLRIP